jgi:Asp-tRNA(Asn)/Glu-tRNA(Gln) amidotransferase A subunit family amidase
MPTAELGMASISVRQLRDAYRRRSLSPVEVVQALLDRIEEDEPSLGAFITPTPGLALKLAREAERAYRGGSGDRPLLGVPVSVKDVFPVRGERTTFGSLVFKDFVTRYDCGVVRRLREAGAVIVGKTNTPEFGLSATTENRIVGPARNPWDSQLTAGGSSGGAAASVGGQLATVGVGSDGGGSIRIPAAFCGLVGVKPTQGLCRNERGFQGMVFSCPGVISRDVGDARDMLEVLAGRRYETKASGVMRLAFDARPGGLPVDPGVGRALSKAVAQLEDRGHRVERVEAPVDNWRPPFTTLVLAQEWRQRGTLLRLHRELLTDHTVRTLEAGSKVTSRSIKEARAAAQSYSVNLDTFLMEYDALILPVTAVTAFAVGQRPRMIDGTPVDTLWGPFPFTAAANLAGVPAISVPCGLVGGLPAALQLVGRRGSEERLLNLAEECYDAWGARALHPSAAQAA